MKILSITSKTIVVTVVVIRLLTFSLYYLSGYGKTFLWNNWFLNTFDHYQLGIFIIGISLLTHFELKHLLFGIGLGLLIDETGQLVSILSLNRIVVQYNSAADWLSLIISLSFCLLLLELNLLKRNKFGV